MPKILRQTIATAALALLATAAHAGDVSLDDVALKPPNDKGSAVIKHVDVKGSSLTADELRKLLSGELPKADAKALVARFNADSLFVSEIDVTSSSATTTVHPINAVGVVAGRFAKLDISGADIVGAKPGVGGHVGPAHVEGLNLVAVLEAAEKGVRPGAGGVTAMTFQGADVQAPEDESKGGLVHVVVAPVNFAAAYDGDFPTKVDFALKGVSVSFGPQSETGAKLRAFGYDKVEIAAQYSATCDKAARTCAGSFTLTWPTGGALTLKGDFGNVSTGPGMGDPGALLAQTVSSFEINFVNAGLVDKIFDAVAKQRNTTAAAMKTQLSAMTAMAPMMLGDADAGKKIGDAFGAFLATPKNLTVGVKAKGAPVPISELTQVRKPADALAKFTLDAKANQ